MPKYYKPMLEKFYCELCNYKCSRKSCWEQHIITTKHERAKNGQNKNNEVTKEFKCDNCEIIFKHQSSFCRHKKNCNSNSEINNNSDKELLVFIIKEMQDMKHTINKQNDIIAQQNIIIEQIKNKEL